MYLGIYLLKLIHFISIFKGSMKWNFKFRNNKIGILSQITVALSLLVLIYFRNEIRMSFLLLASSVVTAVSSYEAIKRAGREFKAIEINDDLIVMQFANAMKDELKLTIGDIRTDEDDERVMFYNKNTEEEIGYFVKKNIIPPCELTILLNMLSPSKEENK